MTTLDPAHQRPSGTSDQTVEAVGKLSEAVEWLERARGRLFDFHQMLGHLDFQVGDAVELLRAAGHDDLATWVDQEAVGRNVLDGRWTYQIIEEFEDVYYEPIKQVERAVRDQLLDGRRHVFEAELKQQRRTHGHLAHELRPPAAHHPRVVTDG